jgi:hypothetical protein
VVSAIELFYDRSFVSLYRDVVARNPGIDAIDVDGDAVGKLVLGRADGRPDLPDGAQNMRSIAFKDMDGSVVFDATHGLTREFPSEQIQAPFCVGNRASHLQLATR